MDNINEEKYDIKYYKNKYMHYCKLFQEYKNKYELLEKSKNENEELKQNIVRLNNAIKLTNQKNNNDNYEKNELNIKIYELNEEKNNQKIITQKIIIIKIIKTKILNK